MGPVDDERQLIEALVGGDSAAWESFVERLRPVVVSATRRTAAGCRFDLKSGDVDDICSEVFSGLVVNDYASLRRFRGRCRLSTWMTVIARRTCLAYLTRMRRVREADVAAGTRSPGGDVPDPLIDMIRSEQRDDLRSGVELLGDKDRQLLDLYFHEQLSYIEIGEKAGISPNSVGPRIGRVIERLRKLVRQT